MNSGNILVAAQLSSLYPSSNAVSLVLQTERRNLPLPPPHTDTDSSSEHASYSSTFHAPHTGTILLRVIHGGLILELISLSTDIPPIRFVFPSAVLPAPAIFTWGEKELHVLAVISSGSLFRLVLPTVNPTRLWHDPLPKQWSREYIVKNVPEQFYGVVQAQGLLCVVIGLTNGSLIRIEAENIGDDNFHDLWAEHVYSPSSFLGTLTSYLPSLQSSSSAGSEILSVASRPQPTELGHIWTLSRDRTLRLWTAKGGCVASKALSLSGKASSESYATSNGIKSELLGAEPRNLLRIFGNGGDDETTYAVAFTPTPSYPQSGGYFQLVAINSDQMREVQTVECSASSTHCHLQDFIINDDFLYTLWERQGSSMTERTRLNLAGTGGSDAIWETATYGEETDLTPTNLDELLRSPGSLADKFMTAILRPGVFSPLTLRTAVEQYTDACLSVSGPHPPPQLTSSHPTTAENIAAVVGCTVALMQDPQTGALQHDRYWNALKRDWEGFVARCREVERSARWPLGLGKGKSRDEVIVIERERVGVYVKEDLPLSVHRYLSDSLPVEPHFAVLDILWTLCDKIGHEALQNLETRIVDILHQEIAFSIVDIIEDQAQRFNFKASLDEPSEASIIARLQGVEDLDGAVRIILDLVAGFEQEVKREEDEVELLLPSSRSDWTTALSTSYITTAVHARYDICIALVTLLFFLADDLKEWDPSLVEEVFAVFRGLAMLRSVARQPAADTGGEQEASDELLTTDDVIARMSNMHVSRNQARFVPTFSLLHRLAGQSGETTELPGAAHRFLDASGMLQSTSPARVTQFEALFCERLRLLGYYEVAREMLAWLPRTPGVVFIAACLYINIGRAEDAAQLMEKVAGSFGHDSGLSLEDAETLASVLPGAVLFDSEFTFYIHASAIFRSSGLIQQEVSFIRLALSVAPQDVDTSELWFGLIRGYIDLGFYEDAYSAIIATPYDSVKRECISQLVYRMCEESTIEQLMSFNFATFSVEIEDALAFKARNTDPRARPFYSRILYTWYTRRGDHRNAARTMYQRARKLQENTAHSTDVITLMEEQLEAYLLAINSLSLLGTKCAWVVIQASPSATIDTESHKRRRLSKNIPDSTFNGDKQDSEIVNLSNFKYDYTLLSARLWLIRRDPTLLSAADVLLSPVSIVLRLGQANQFDMAMATARSLDVDMSELFATLTTQCLRLSRNPETVLQEDTSDWLLTDNVSSWPGSPADRGWRYLRVALERHDSTQTDYKYSKTAFETILSSDRSSPPPPWLVHSLEENHHEYLIRTSLRYDIIESALEHSLSLLHKANTALSRAPQKTASVTWLPYTLIDQVLAASAQNDLTTRGQRLRTELQTEVNNRVKRMQKMSRFAV
ncbi:nucleoporin Nup120/160-domain-containing protein [Suillus subalutaceus]|uniref:nucleoporin Nup120/160-domain-containing protein n=1 Tax=Suillus subalutaceus TaxID=48586 RepID=UPI001B87E955|nr:nucleoporin Nup120/160-domain-containing protein [Suillus subalutaceus]KAG1847541.1 nucleoporin Nup120/160-domain-containing protein [Suillus subalutaceus]